MSITTMAGALIAAAVAQEAPKPTEPSATDFINDVVDGGVEPAPSAEPTPEPAPSATKSDVPAAPAGGVVLPGQGGVILPSQGGVVLPGVEKRKIITTTGEVEMTLAEYKARSGVADDTEAKRQFALFPKVFEMKGQNGMYIKIEASGTPNVPVEVDAEDFSGVGAFIPGIGVGFKRTGPGITGSAGAYIDFMVQRPRYGADGAKVQGHKLSVGYGFEGTIGGCGNVGNGVCLGAEAKLGIGGLANVEGADDGSLEGKYPDNLLTLKAGGRVTLQVKGVEVFAGADYMPMFDVSGHRSYGGAVVFGGGINILPLLMKKSQ